MNIERGRQNQGVVKEADAGFYKLLTATWTKISNKRRQALFIILAVKELTRLEKLVAAMPYEEVERLCVHHEPIAGENGSATVPKEEPQAEVAPTPA